MQLNEVWPKLKNFRSSYFLIIGYAALLLCSASLSAICSTRSPTVEAKAGYFLFTDSKMRKVYRQGGVDLQVCGSYPVFQCMNRIQLAVYGAVEYLYCKGHSLSAHQGTSFTAVPVNLGVQSSAYLTPCMRYYITLGPRFFYCRQRNHSDDVSKSNSRNGVGAFANVGMNYNLSERIFLDLFCEYSYAQTHFHTKKAEVYTRSIQIGGFTFGGGLGYSF